MKLTAPLDANRNELRQVRSENLATAPTTPVVGQRYYDTTLRAERVYDGTNWSTLADVAYVSTSAPPGTPNVGDLWYDTDQATVGPGEELAYNEITSNATITATTTATATLAIEGTTRAYDGSPIIVEFYTALLYSPAVVGTWTVVNLWDGNTDLGQFGQVGGGNANAIGTPCFSRRRITPTVGTHNYRIKAWVASSGSGTVAAGAGAPVYVPAFIRVTRA